MQGMSSNPLTLPFPQASMALGSMPSMGNGQLGQPNSFSQTYAQQLQNQLLMQQGGSFPFLGPGGHSPVMPLTALVEAGLNCQVVSVSTCTS